MIRVTITGADDAVAVADLANLSKEFRFVEWGILFSSKRTGAPRYPSLEWVEQLVRHDTDWFVLLSAHLCGETMRQALRGHLPRVVDESVNELNSFRRVQLNGCYGASFGDELPKFNWPHVRPIIQARSASELRFAFHDAGIQPHATDILFDASGGRGIQCNEWPQQLVDDERQPGARTRIGFAGGITPDNVKSAIAGIMTANPQLARFEIDMESGVRTDDVFDLAKVRSVLEQVAALNVGRAW